MNWGGMDLLDVVRTRGCREGSIVSGKGDDVGGFVVDSVGI